LRSPEASLHERSTDVGKDALAQAKKGQQRNYIRRGERLLGQRAREDDTYISRNSDDGIRADTTDELYPRSPVS
jgi:hypothetical protein